MDLDLKDLDRLSDSQLRFLNKNKLTDDQLAIALAVDKEARRQGVNPEFVWPMVYQESKFQQDAVSPKGAIGVMQLMPDTSKGLKVNPNDLGQNISGGISLLKELMLTPDIGNDPYKVLAGYNASTASRNKFYQSKNLDDLPDETLIYMNRVAKYYGGDLPDVSFEPKALPEQQPTNEAVVAGNEENIYSGTPVTEFDSVNKRSPVETGAMTGLTGAGAGTIYTAKAPAVRLAQKVGLLPGGKPITPSDAAQLVERTMSANSPDVPAKPLQGGEKWQKSLTGVSTPNAQMGKSSLDLAKDMQSAVGMKGAPGFTGGTITEGGIILNPRDAAAVQAKQAAAQPFVAPQPMQNASKGVLRSILGSAPVRGALAGFGALRSILGSVPVKGGLAGFGLGYGVQDAYNRNKEGRSGEAVASGLGTAASLVAPFVSTALAAPLGVAGAAIPLYLSASDRIRHLQEHPEDYRLQEDEYDAMGNRQR